MTAARPRPLSLCGGAGLAALMSVAACASPAGETPAVLVADDPAARAALMTALAGASGRAAVDLGAGDPTTQPSLAVLPPPPAPTEDMSLARPTVFDLVLRDGACYAVRREDSAAFALPPGTCRPAPAE